MSYVAVVKQTLLVQFDFDFQLLPEHLFLCDSGRLDKTQKWDTEDTLPKANNYSRSVFNGEKLMM